MTYPLASEQDLLEEIAEVDRLLTEMDSARIVDQSQWFNLRETRLEERERLVADLARVRVDAP